MRESASFIGHVRGSGSFIALDGIGTPEGSGRHGRRQQLAAPLLSNLESSTQGIEPSPSLTDVDDVVMQSSISQIQTYLLLAADAEARGDVMTAVHQVHRTIDFIEDVLFLGEVLAPTSKKMSRRSSLHSLLGAPLRRTSSWLPPEKSEPAISPGRGGRRFRSSSASKLHEMILRRQSSLSDPASPQRQPLHPCGESAPLDECALEISETQPEGFAKGLTRTLSQNYASGGSGAEASSGREGQVPPHFVPSAEALPSDVCLSDLADVAGRSGFVTLRDVRGLHAALESRLKRLMSVGLSQEQKLLGLPDVLVGVGYPGNPRVRGTRFGDGAGLDLSNEAPTLAAPVAALRFFLSHGTRWVRTEWCLRVTLSAAVSMCLVALPSAPTSLHAMVWLPVLAIATTKPTLGDTLEGWWFAISGMLLGFLLLLPLLPLTDALLTLPRIGSHTLAAAAACVPFTLIIGLLGDHIQARWALLVPLVGMLELASLDASSTTVSAWHVVAKASEPLKGAAIGGAIAVCALLLPFPRLASIQVAQRLAQAYRQALRLHGILLVAFAQPEMPHTLHHRATALLEQLDASLQNVENLVRVCRWELFFFNAAKLRRHASLLLALARNLRLRVRQRNTFARHEVHRCVARASAEVGFGGVNKAAVVLRHAACELLGDSIPSAEEVEQARAELLESQEQLLSAWRTGLAASAPSSDGCGSRAESWPAPVGTQTRKPSPLASCTDVHAQASGPATALPLRICKSTAMFEAMLLVAEFDALLLAFDILPRSKAEPASSPPSADNTPGEAAQRNERTPTWSSLQSFASWRVVPSLAHTRKKQLAGAARALFPAAFLSSLEQALHSLDGAESTLSPACFTRGRLHLACRSTLSLVLCGSVAWLLTDNNSRLHWVPADLVEDLPVFCPVTVVFVYQLRTHALIPRLSRTWRWLVGTYVGCLWALWALYVANGDALTLIVMLVLLVFPGSYVHGDDFFGYAGLVAAFTAPIVALGVNPTGSKLVDNATYARRALARLSQSFTGAAVVALLALLWQTREQRAEHLLQRRLLRVLNALHANATALVGPGGRPTSPKKERLSALRRGENSRSETPPTRRTHAAGRARTEMEISSHMRALETLMREAEHEPSIYYHATFPVGDYAPALAAVEGAWESALQVLKYLNEPTHGEMGGDFHSRFQHCAVPLLRPVCVTLLHMIVALESFVASAAGRASHASSSQRRVEAQLRSAIPHSLYELYSAAQRYWESIDEEWTPLLWRYLQTPPSETLAERDGAARGPFIAFLSSGAMLYELRFLSQHVAALAWRMANIIEKEMPSKAFVPEPQDLYRNEVQV